MGTCLLCNNLIVGVFLSRFSYDWSRLRLLCELFVGLVVNFNDICMKKKLIFLIIIGVFVALHGCSPIGNKKNIVNNVELFAANDLIFALDDSTVQSLEYLQFFQRNDSNILAFTNEYDNSIVFYDYSTKKYVNRIHFDKEGNNGVGTVLAFCYLNNDSIFLYNMLMQTLFLTDNMGTVKEKYKLEISRNFASDSLFIAPLLFPRTNSPLTKVGDELLIAGFFPNEFEGENERNRPVMTYLNCKSHAIRYSDSYPAIYHKGNWGGGLSYRNPFFTISPQNEIVLSFAADSQIRVHAVKAADYMEFYAGIGGEHKISPAEEDIRMDLFTYEKQRRHYIQNLSYGAIHYDQYRNVYYRLAFLPDSEIDIQDEALRKPMEIIVLNDRFEIIGKSRIEDDLYWVNQCFVGPDGFHVQVKSADDDILYFKTFVYEKSE